MLTDGKKRWTAVYNICWYGMLAAVTLFTAFRANINLFEKIQLPFLEWFATVEMQPIFNTITFLMLAALLAIRLIVHVVLIKIAEQTDEISFEEMKDRYSQCQQEIKENANEANEIKILAHKLSYKAEAEQAKTKILLQSAQRDTRSAWNELFAEYCHATPKLRKVIERTVKGFKQTLDRWERKD